MEIVEQLEKVDWIGVVKNINNTITNFVKFVNVNLENTNLNGISDLFDNDSQTTADITKWISALFNVYLKDKLSLLGFSLESGDGSDMSFKGTPIEMKTTQNISSFTGNKHSSKKPYHLLISYGLNEIGIINEMAVVIINLDDCKETKWVSENSSKSSFSSLKLNKKDKDKIYWIVGNGEEKRVYIHCKRLAL